jgi:hypothetical protein
MGDYAPPDVDSVANGFSNPAVAHQDTSSGATTLPWETSGGTIPIDVSGQGSVNTNSDGTAVGVQGSGTAGPQASGSATGSTTIGDAKVDGQVQGQAGVQGWGGVGSYTNPQGRQTYGVDGSVTTASGSAQATFSNPDQGSATVGIDAQGPNAFAGASLQTGPGMNTAHIGAEANLGGVGVTVNDNSNDSSEKESIHAGLSEGVGLDGRVHYGTGPDGQPRYGLGADVGPVSLDVTTEDPVRTGLGLLAAPFTAGLSMSGSQNPLNPLNYVDTDDNGKQNNMTNDAIAAGGRAVNAVEEAGSQAVNTVENTASSVWNWMTN